MDCPVVAVTRGFERSMRSKATDRKPGRFRGVLGWTMQRYRVLVYSQSMSVMSVVCIMISVYVMFHWSESEQDTPEIPLVQ